MNLSSLVRDAKEDDELEYRQWKRYHSEDIFSMDMHGNKLLVTASYSGDIIVWNIDSGQAFCRFNPYQSPQPLLPVQVGKGVRTHSDMCNSSTIVAGGLSCGHVMCRQGGEEAANEN